MSLSLDTKVRAPELGALVELRTNIGLARSLAC